jgi:hypothetical protein
MPLLRALCSLLIVLAFGLGTIMPASHGAMGHEMAVSAVEAPMTADCDHCTENAALPVPCAKVFCAGTAMILPVAEGMTEPASARRGLAPDQVGSGVSRLPDPPPPRTVLIG